MDEKQALWPIGELARRVAAALAVGYDGPGNARVRGVPDIRSIRWYTTIGLLDKPGGFRGRTALYGPRHLRQLVAVKRRQAAGAPLSRIQAELAGASPVELERLARVPAELLDGPAEADVSATTDAGTVEIGVSGAVGAAESTESNPSAERRDVAANGSVPGEAAAESARVAPEHGVELTEPNPAPQRPDGAAQSDERLGESEFTGSAVGDRSEPAGSASADAPKTMPSAREPLDSPGSAPAEATFWKTPPVNVAVTATPRHADPPAAMSYGLKLAEGLTLLVEAAHCPTREDHEAVLAAAQPLLRALKARGLHTIAYTGVSP